MLSLIPHQTAFRPMLSHHSSKHGATPDPAYPFSGVSTHTTDDFLRADAEGWLRLPLDSKSTKREELCNASLWFRWHVKLHSGTFAGRNGLGATLAALSAACTSAHIIPPEYCAFFHLQGSQRLWISARWRLCEPDFFSQHLTFLSFDYLIDAKKDASFIHCLGLRLSPALRQLFQLKMLLSDMEKKSQTFPFSHQKLS